MSRLDETLWPTVVDVVAGWMGQEQISFAEVRSRLSNSPEWSEVLSDEDLAEVEPRVRARWRESIRSERRDQALEKELLTRGPGESDGLPRMAEDGVLAMLADAFAAVFGVGVAEIRTVWRRGPCRSLRDGDRAEMVWGAGHGGGEEWLVCAVKITRGNGQEVFLPEHKIVTLGKRPPKTGGYRGRRLEMRVLDAEHAVKAHDPKRMMRRIAAWKLAYFGPRSGMAHMVELAKLNGVTKQAVHQQMNGVRRIHRERTGDKVARIGGSGMACGRRAGVGGARKKAPNIKHQAPGKLQILSSK